MRTVLFSGLLVMALGGCFRDRPAVDAHDTEYSDRDEYQYVSSPAGSEAGDGAYYGVGNTAPSHQPANPSAASARTPAPGAPTWQRRD